MTKCMRRKGGWAGGGGEDFSFPGCFRCRLLSWRQIHGVVGVYGPTCRGLVGLTSNVDLVVWPLQPEIGLVPLWGTIQGMHNECI